MNVSDYQKMFRQTLRPEVVYAGEYLEHHGLRFGVEFGTTNCVKKATDMVLVDLEALAREDDLFGV